ncbi:glucocorticoid receptor-like (DNA-binding domain) [Conidiobolus coronatus NRRL 28638]|jgi:small subunit ribosomal protein S14|uniref:Glucocorticoid receptor-like (DNA-binding domain) n=1 Tax=Conidiobolus coronatus (strain ATCC 28846 / CBS 209.66 / NRRL 28638) TaxID=796925 RepID=A0A137P3I2_CONC2|nr:glucocorticoid receptor-like (DNA-binding domain) [Conidiobolus coronatus NRRL 28638]|eukprot:KXN69499.1 glucocorticoid receptor-like (DNA-binding domain) [Conidiobolus coronatus NRRL 28638]
MRAAVRRDHNNRIIVAGWEVLRQAYRYIARNEANPTRIRYQAQLALHNIPRNACPTTISPRCVETGRGRGILSDFRLCRYQFRMKALRGELPGVQKATW